MCAAHSAPRVGESGPSAPGQLLHRYGVAHLADGNLFEGLHVDASRVATPQDTAVSMVMQHPEIASFDPTTHERAKAIVAGCQSLTGLWSYLSNNWVFPDPADDGDDPWYVNTVVRDAGGNVMSPADGLKNKDGEPIVWPMPGDRRQDRDGHPASSTFCRGR